MPTFKVVPCNFTYEGAPVRGTEIVVEAATKLDAAQIVRGAALREAGKRGQLRAEVWDAQSTHRKVECFHAL